MHIFVGNLPLDATEKDLFEVFEPFGQVNSVKIIKDKLTHEPVGFGFVEMTDDRHALRAIGQVDRKTIKGRMIMVSESSERIERRMSSRKSDNHRGTSELFSDWSAHGVCIG